MTVFFWLIRTISLVVLIPWVGFSLLGVLYPTLKPLERAVFIPITLSYPLVLFLCWRRETFLRSAAEVGWANLFAVLPLLLVLGVLVVGAYFNTRGK